MKCVLWLLSFSLFIQIGFSYFKKDVSRPTSGGRLSMLYSEVLGARIDASELNRDDFRRLYEGRVPVVLTNVYDFDNDCYIEEVMGRMSQEMIEFDVRTDKNVETYEASMQDFIDAMIDSRHSASFYYMDEDILTRTASDRIDELDLPEHLFGKDYFSYFPELVRPRSALVIGGMGSRSFLHADPYEWIGTSYLFEGIKLWTFIPPDSEWEDPAFKDKDTASHATRDAPQDDRISQQRGYPTASEVLNSRRQTPDAWGGLFNFSAGWVSDVDLYRQQDSDGIASINLYYSEMYEKYDKVVRGIERERELIRRHDNNNNIDENGHMVNEDGNTNINRYPHIINSALIRRPKVVPSFKSGIDRVDSCDNRVLKGAVQILQKEGDLLIIPPRWWHQVYNLQPTVAVASQYMNDVVKDRVIDHMLQWNGLSRRDPEIPTGFGALSTRRQILATMEACLCANHGREKGLRALQRLLSVTKPTDRSGGRSHSSKVTVSVMGENDGDRPELEAKVQQQDVVEADLKFQLELEQGQKNKYIKMDTKTKTKDKQTQQRSHLRNRLVRSRLKKNGKQKQKRKWRHSDKLDSDDID
jgi:hypothetical protein